MKLDNEQQREVILAAINACNFRGEVVEVVFDLKRAVTTAEIDRPAEVDGEKA